MDPTTTDRTALEGKVLAELQQIAGDLGIQGTQRLRKAGLIDAIVERAGNDGPPSDGRPTAEPSARPSAEPAEAPARPADDGGVAVGTTTMAASAGIGAMRPRSCTGQLCAPQAFWKL